MSWVVDVCMCVCVFDPVKDNECHEAMRGERKADLKDSTDGVAY